MKWPRLMRTLVLGICLGSSVVMGGEGSRETEERGFRQVVAYHVEKYPLMQIRDLYKLVFQSAKGSEHAVPDQEVARQWLEREVSTLDIGSDQSLSEPLSPDGELVRVHLRAYRDAGGDWGRLLDAFVETTYRFEGSDERLRRYWGYIEAMAGQREIPFEVAQIQELWEQLDSQGFPAVHHSDRYKERYRPAYRVVLLELLGLDADSIRESQPRSSGAHSDQQ